ncbi:MAG: NADH-quinone oxidoreductase subunit D, partial [Opitutaceae bacterium]|nr:NADH-quinone oxidoreductase subunit D [Opitutaceae bacterium]
VNDKERLYELGGTLPDDHFKWDKKKAAEQAAAAGGHD